MPASLTFSPLRAVILLSVLGGTFTILADRVRHRFGRRYLAVFWGAGSVLVGSFGAVRNLAAQQRVGVAPARVSAPGMFALFIVAALVVLSVPTAILARRHATAASSGVIRGFLTGAAWAMIGFVLMIVLGVVLDVANVPFLPFR